MGNEQTGRQVFDVEPSTTDAANSKHTELFVVGNEEKSAGRHENFMEVTQGSESYNMRSIQYQLEAATRIRK